MDLQLNDGGTDLVLDKGDLVLVSGRDAVRQHLAIRLRTFLGECFLDTRVGMPYFQQILVKDPNVSAVRALYRKAIMTTPGVTDLKALEVTVDWSTRTASVAFAVETTDGDLELIQEMVL